MTTTIVKPARTIEDWPLLPQRTPEQELALKVAEIMNKQNWCQGSLYNNMGRRCALGHAMHIGGRALAQNLKVAFYVWQHEHGKMDGIASINDCDGLDAIRIELRAFGNADLKAL